jgi:hypothetical protein
VTLLRTCGTACRHRERSRIHGENEEDHTSKTVAIVLFNSGKQADCILESTIARYWPPKHDELQGDIAVSARKHPPKAASTITWYTHTRHGYKCKTDCARQGATGTFGSAQTGASRLSGTDGRRPRFYPSGAVLSDPAIPSRRFCAKITDEATGTFCDTRSVRMKSRRKALLYLSAISADERDSTT